VAPPLDYEALRSRVFKLAYVIVHNQASAEDIAQETLARTIEHEHELREQADPTPWVFGVAVNLCRSKMRSDKRRAKTADPAALDQARAKRRGPLTSAMVREVHHRVALAVAGLPDSLREVFVLHYVEDLPYETVANVCGISQGAARLRGMRARDALQTKLSSLMGTRVRRRLEAEGPTPKDAADDPPERSNG